MWHGNYGLWIWVSSQKTQKIKIVKTLKSKLCSEKQYDRNIGLYVSHKQHIACVSKMCLHKRYTTHMKLVGHIVIPMGRIACRYTYILIQRIGPLMPKSVTLRRVVWFHCVHLKEVPLSPFWVLVGYWQWIKEFHLSQKIKIWNYTWHYSS